jgi:hypothetical protein
MDIVRLAESRPASHTVLVTGRQHHSSHAEQVWYNATSPIFFRDTLVKKKRAVTRSVHISRFPGAVGPHSHSPTDNTRCQCRSHGYGEKSVISCFVTLYVTRGKLCVDNSHFIRIMPSPDQTRPQRWDEYETGISPPI